MKVRRNEVARRLFSNSAETDRTRNKSALDRVLERSSEARLNEDLGMSSLDRVELLSEVEKDLGSEIDEDRFAQIRTVGELRELTKARSLQIPENTGTRVGRWPQALAVRAFRFVVQHSVVFPLFKHYIPVTTEGLDNLRGIQPPVIFAANHTSHLDTVAILAALPEPWRRLLAPAMSKDYFRAWFERGSWRSGSQYILARSIFNTYPLAQRMSGVKASLEFSGDLVQRGFCPLVFPEGERTPDGAIQPFRPGIALMAIRLQVPVIPIALVGLYEVFSVHDHWPRRGYVRVIFGKPLRFPSHTAIPDATAMVEREVHALFRSAPAPQLTR
jgi:long-chain acyl-CoA synthetase